MLMARVARRVKDKRVLKLIRAYLNAGVMVNGVCQRNRGRHAARRPAQSASCEHPAGRSGQGTDQNADLRFVRYADDCNIFVASKRAGERVMESVIRFVEGKLKLKVNRDKSAVDRPWNRKFLGFSFLSNKQATIRLAPKTISPIQGEDPGADGPYAINVHGGTHHTTEPLHDGMGRVFPTGIDEDTL